jgi:hypothetical protein
VRKKVKKGKHKTMDLGKAGEDGEDGGRESDLGSDVRRT